SYATYIGTAMALAMKGTVSNDAALIGLAFTGAGIGGVVGGTMWNVHYALNVLLNRWAERIALSGDAKRMWMPNLLGGQLIGFACRFIPAVIVLLAVKAGAQAGISIPGWFITGISTFGSMMAALGMGVILSFLIRKKYDWAIFLIGFVLVTYFSLGTMAVAVIGVLAAIIFYQIIDRKEVA
ncbi:MAG: PTS sugar transporter subunit IIC, partial [Oscillospiraceae bacterium]